MTRTLAFDVYGTLIDPLGVVAVLEQIVADKAPVFAALWRQKQLEYTFRRAAMRHYEDFLACTRQALQYARESLGISLLPGDEERLMGKYRELPPYPDVRKALKTLRESGHRQFAFSNGHPDDLVALLAHAGIDTLLDGIVSVHEARSFKPDPVVYKHFLASSGADTEHCWLVSGNAFDIIGADACGWHTAWVKRDPKAHFDPWEVTPTLVVKDLSELGQAFAAGPGSD